MLRLYLLKDHVGSEVKYAGDVNSVSDTLRALKTSARNTSTVIRNKRKSTVELSFTLLEV